LNLKLWGIPYLKHFQAQNFGTFKEGLNVNQFENFFCKLVFRANRMDQGV